VERSRNNMEINDMGNNVSRQLEQVILKISEGKDPKEAIKQLKIQERNKYIVNGKIMRLLVLMLMQFYNLVSMSQIFPEEEE